MTDKFKSYIYRLYLPECKKELIDEILSEIMKLNSIELEPLKKIIAEVFCKSMIVATQQKYLNQIDINLINTTFNNIKGLYNKCEESFTVYEIILSFLFQLQLPNKAIDNFPEIENIIDKLDDMNSIFLLEYNKELLFPIGDLLSLVFKRNLNFTTLDNQTLNVFLLSMKVFKKEKDFEKQYNKLIKRCKLKCLEYLGNYEYEPLGDTTIWKENLVRNGSLVLINTTKNKVYIRNNKKEYFSNYPDKKIKKELNSQKDPIGYYYEYTLPNNVEFTSVEKIFENGNLNEIYKILELLYDKQFYNIFLNKAIYKSNNNIFPTNIFADNDKSIIINNTESEKEIERNANRNELTYVLKRYSFIKLFSNENCITDFILLGSFCSLLSFFSEQKVKEVIDFLLKINSNFQAETINYFLEKNEFDDTLKFFSYYLSKTNYIKTPKSISNQQLSGMEFLPYKFPVAFLNNKISEIIKIPCETFDFVKPSITFTLNDEIKSVEYNDIKIDYELIDKPEDISNIYGLLLNNKIYFNNDLDRIASFYNKIKQENLSLKDFSLIDTIPVIQLNDVITKMELHKDALCALGKKYLTPDFKTIAIIRLFHHCVCFRIFDNNWNKFYSILKNHNFLKFDYLNNQINLTDGILYVPKDKEENDATLKTIFSNYIFNNPASRNRSIYNYIIDKDQELKYTSRNKEIKEIVFIFDNIINGRSTVKCLNTYLDLRVDGVSNYLNIQHYYFKNNEVTISEIIKTNNIKFKIKVFWATREGERKVLDFINIHCPEYFESNGLEIDNYIDLTPSEEFIQNVNDLYETKFNKTDYPVIREFNLPSVYVFPDEVVEQKNISTIFVRKNEVYNLRDNQIN